LRAGLSLAQQIAQLSQAAPADLDPDALHPPASPSGSDSHEFNSAAREHYIDVGPSVIRRHNAALSDPKYTGTRVSRKNIDREGSSSSDEEESEDIGDAMSATDKDISPEHWSADGAVQPMESQNNNVLHPPTFSGVREEHTPHPQVAQTSDLASALRATREQDRKKGKAVARQITLWDMLLDARIRVQKAVTAVNELPLTPGIWVPMQLTSASADPSIEPGLNQLLEEGLALSEDIFTLQEGLLRTDITSLPPRKRAKKTHSDERVHGDELQILSWNASQLEAAFHPHLVQTLSKWSAKIQAVAPSVLLPSNRTSFKNPTAQGAGPGIVEVIDAVLTSDTHKYLTRTRRKVIEDDEGPASDNSAEVIQIFDDTDFYQQLLRDVIELRGAEAGDSVGEQEWMRRQKMSKAKRRKIIDTKASKGRKLRYQIHEKLQNFMVPIITLRGAWHDEQVDELFSSLLNS
ncbi:TRAUB-domain-containing protein, partial [Trametopsis cervina]